MLNFKKIKGGDHFKAMGISCLVFVCFIPHIAFSQSKLCTGVYGDTLIFKDFGTGADQYSIATPQSLGFSTTFENRLLNLPRQTTNDGYYSLVNSIPNDFGVWHTAAQDHNPRENNGYMLLVNGDELLGEFYRDTIKGLCVGATYEYSSWLANVFRPGANPAQQNAPNVRFEIRNTSGQMIDSLRTGPINMTTALTWRKYGITFQSPATSVVLVMVSVAPRGVGNDIVIDDIAFVPCIPATITITPTINVCVGGSGTFTVSVAGNADYGYSQWQISRDGGTNWSYVGSVIAQTGSLQNYNVDLPLTNIPITDDDTRYRLVLSTSPGNLSTPNSSCNVISPISLLRVNAYPILKITHPAPTCNTSIDLTDSSIVSGSTITNATLSYYNSLANANNETSALTTAQAKAISTSGTYYIRAASNTTPACVDVKPVNMVIDVMKNVTLVAPESVCKDNASFTVTATKTNITNLDWRSNNNSSTLQSGTNTSLVVVPTAANLLRDSIWVKVSSNDAILVCPNVKDSVRVNFVKPPKVMLPADTVFCENQSGLNLSVTSKTVNNPNTITWTSSLASVPPNPTTGITSIFNLSNQGNPISLYVTGITTGCNPSRDTMRVSFVRKPILTASKDTAICHSGNTISVNLLAHTRNVNQIVWTNSIGTLAQTNDSTATLLLTPTNASQTVTSKVNISASNAYCPADTELVNITLNPIPTLRLPNDTLLCGSSVFTFPVNAIATNANVYAWKIDKVALGSLSTTNALATNLSTGVVTKLDSMSVILSATSTYCGTAYDTMKVVLDAPKTLSLTEPDSLCKNNPSFNVTPSSQNVTNINWSSSSNAVVNPQNFSALFNYQPSATDLLNNNVFVYAASSDPVLKCPNVYDTLKVIFVDLPTVLLPSDSSFCHSGDVKSFDIKGSITNYDHANWQSTLGTLTKKSDSVYTYTYNPSLNASIRDSISVEVSNANCPLARDYLLVQYFPNPTLKARNDTTLCTGASSIALNAVSLNAATYLWNVDKPVGVFNSDNTLNTTFSMNNTVHDDTLMFTITATSNNCGALVDSVVYIYEKPLVVTASHVVTCISDLSTSLTADARDVANNVLSGTWSSTGQGAFEFPITSANNRYIPAQNDVDVSFVDLTFGSTGQKICPNKDTTFRFNISPLPFANAGPDTSFCIGLEFIRNISTNPKFRYKWSVLSNNVLHDSISGTGLVQFLPTGASKVLLSVTNAIGCIDTGSFDIAIQTPPIITLPQHECLVNSLSLVPVLDHIPTKGYFIWSKNNQNIDSSSSVHGLSILESGTYILKYSDQTCKSSATTLVTSPPVLTLNDKQACYGVSVTLLAPEIKKASYFWNNAPTSSTNIYSVTASNTIETVDLRVVDSLACESTISAKVSGVPFPDFVLTATNVCFGETGKISTNLLDPAQENTYSIDYQWALNGNNIGNTTWKGIDFTSSGLYKLTTAIGDCKISKNIAATIYPLPEILAKEQYRYCNDDPDSVLLTSEDSYKHYWYLGNDLFAVSNRVNVHPDAPTSYRLEAETQYGCKSSKPIHVDICCPPRLFVPNVITPNSNDINSYMNIFGKHFIDFELTIFNRWGEIIYNTRDSQLPWGGFYLNEQMPVGVYPWMITYDAECPIYKKHYKIQGDVTVVK